VFYQVYPPGEGPYNSRTFDLHIWDLDRGWPIIQITSPSAPGNVVSLKTVSGAVTFLLLSWPFMAEGQRVRIIAKGVPQAGEQDTYNLRKGDAEIVTSDEYNAGKVEAELPRIFLTTLTLGLQFNLAVEISFDGGVSYKQFPMISPQLVP